MKVSMLEIDPSEEEEIIIKCHEINDEIMDLVSKIRTSNSKITGTLDGKIYQIPLETIYYYETVDNKGFVYTDKHVFETKLKLFEFLSEYGGTCFFRASKSIVLNISKIAYIKPSISSRFEVTLKNQEKIVVSRQYVSDLKRLLGM